MPAQSWPEKRIHNALATYRPLHFGRRGSFLRRNLSKALDHHQHALETQNGSVACNDTSSTLPQNQVSWNFPDGQMVSTIACHQDAVLHINLKTLRPKELSLNNSVERPAANNLVFTMECQLTFTLARKDSSGQWKHAPQYKDFRWATIKASRDGNAIITMEESLKIHARTFRALEMQHRGKISPVKQFGSLYSLRVSIECGRASDNQILLHFVGLDQQDVSHAQEIRAWWHRLPRCPNGDEGLSLQLAKPNGTQSTHTLQVDMGWVSPTMSRVMKEISRQCGNCPRALAVDATEQPTRTKLPRTTYRYSQLGSSLQHQRLVVQGYVCGFCSMCFFKKPSHLQLHLRLDHDRFAFTFKESSSALHAAPDLLVEITFADCAEKNRLEGLGNIQWIAPDRPFDICAHLAGDESWIGGEERKPPAAARLAALNAPKRKKPEEVPDLAKPVRKRYRVPRIQDNQDLKLWAMHSRRPLSEGEEISEDEDSLAPSHLVSKVPRKIEKDPRLPRAAVNFMKRWNVHMVEERLDADRYLGDAVVRFFRHNDMWLRNTPGMSREFLKKIGELDEDGLIDSQVYEFCKTGTQASILEIGDETNEKTGEKRKRNTMSEDLDSSCLPNSLKKTKPNGIETNGIEMSHGKENVPLKYSIPVRDGPNNTPVKSSVLRTSLAMGETRPSGIETQSKSNAAALGKQETTRPNATGSGLCACVCGKPVSAIDWPEAIYCASAACARRDFHLACLKLNQRIMSWKCEDCTSRDATMAQTNQNATVPQARQAQSGAIQWFQEWIATDTSN